jgi:hypothetical protein
MEALKKQRGVSARALEFTVSTAARTNEPIGTIFDEVGFQIQAWTAPAARMKGGREHRVPPSTQAIKIIEGLAIKLKQLIGAASCSKNGAD